MGLKYQPAMSKGMDHKSRFELTRGGLLIITSEITDSVGGSTSTDFALVSTWKELIDGRSLKTDSARASVAVCGPSLIWVHIEMDEFCC